jgi:hypothetical protein
MIMSWDSWPQWTYWFWNGYYSGMSCKTQVISYGFDTTVLTGAWVGGIGATVATAGTPVMPYVAIGSLAAIAGQTKATFTSIMSLGTCMWNNWGQYNEQ